VPSYCSDNQGPYCTGLQVRPGTTSERDQLHSRMRKNHNKPTSAQEGRHSKKAHQVLRDFFCFLLGAAFPAVEDGCCTPAQAVDNATYDSHFRSGLGRYLSVVCLLIVSQTPKSSMHAGHKVYWWHVVPTTRTCQCAATTQPTGMQGLLRTVTVSFWPISPSQLPALPRRYDERYVQ
jgi:hypothetical protein